MKKDTAEEPEDLCRDILLLLNWAKSLPAKEKVKRTDSDLCGYKGDRWASCKEECKVLLGESTDCGLFGHSFVSEACGRYTCHSYCWGCILSLIGM